MLAISHPYRETAVKGNMQSRADGAVDSQMRRQEAPSELSSDPPLLMAASKVSRCIFLRSPHSHLASSLPEFLSKQEKNSLVATRSVFALNLVEASFRTELK